jgi:3-methyladenine DNA glycosylase/8-oxoguanine DNA glycosylase
MEPSRRQHGISGAKATYTRSLARPFHGGQIDPHDLDKLDNEDVHASLAALKVSGHERQKCFRLFGTGRRNLWSPGDWTLRKTVWTFLVKAQTSRR